MEKFKSFITEQEQTYKLLIVSHDDPLDPNETAPMVRKKASELGLGSYMEDDGDGKLFYSYPVDDKGKVEMPDMKNDVEYDKPFKINPKDTLVMMRGLNAKSGCASWWTMARTLEESGFKVVNSVLCNEIYISFSSLCSINFLIYFIR